jgi:hypothetical protein
MRRPRDTNHDPDRQADKQQHGETHRPNNQHYSSKVEEGTIVQWPPKREKQRIKLKLRLLKSRESRVEKVVVCWRKSQLLHIIMCPSCIDRR